MSIIGQVFTAILYKHNHSFKYLNDCLNFGAHEHQQILRILPGDDLPGSQPPIVAACLWVFLLLLWSSVSEKLLDWGEPGLMTWPSRKIQLFCLPKVLICFYSLFRVIIPVHCQLLSCQFCSIWLNKRPIHIRIHLATSISSQIINKPCMPHILVP